YDLLHRTLEGCARAPATAVPAVTLAFQLQLSSLLGYRPRLDACASCSGALSARRLFSPARGGLLCDACAAREGGVIALSADALAGFALLLSRPVEEAGDYIEVKRWAELLRVVEAFLRMHFEKFRGLRSLEVLRSVEAQGGGGPARLG